MEKNNLDLLNYASQGNIERLQEIIDTEIDVNVTNSDGENALHKAMEWLPHLKHKDFLGTTNLLIKAGINVNQKDKWGATPLFLAAGHGFYNVVLTLFEHGANDEIIINGNYSALHEIANKMGPGFKNEKLTILQNDINTTYTDSNYIKEILGGSLIDEYNGYVLTAALLVKRGADIHIKTTDTLQPPLILAAANGSVELIKLILNKSNDEINYQDKFGLTALHFACRNGFLNAVEELIKHSADPNIQENYGFTTLHEAILSNNVDIVRYLLKKGANKNIVLTKKYNKYEVGDNALDIARKSNKEKILKILETF